LEVNDVDGKTALCWILGQFGECVEDSPYMLEKLIEDSKELQNPQLTASLMASTMKLFFKRAPETKRILATIFKEVMTNCSDIHVKQRAVMLYRLLQTNMPLAKQLCEQEAGDFDIFFEDKNDECRERLFWEFNSLSVVYQKPCERFLKDGVLKQAQAQEKKYFPERVRKIKAEKREDD